MGEGRRGEGVDVGQGFCSGKGCIGEGRGEGSVCRGEGSVGYIYQNYPRLRREDNDHQHAIYTTRFPLKRHSHETVGDPFLILYVQ